MAALLAIDQNKRATVRQALGHRWLQTVPEWGPDLACSASVSSGSGEGGGGGGSSPLMRAQTIAVRVGGGGDGEMRDGGGGGGSGPPTKDSEDSYFNESRSVW